MYMLGLKTHTTKLHIIRLEPKCTITQSICLIQQWKDFFGIGKHESREIDSTLALKK